MRHWDARLKRYTGIVFILMFGAAGVAFLFSSKLQAVISRPILDLERDDADRLEPQELRVAGAQAA